MARPVKWTYQACAEAAARFKSRVEFSHGANSAYQTASRNGWLADCCAHMPEKRDLSYHHARAAAAECHTRTEFRTRFPHLQNAAYRHGWLDDCCNHMAPAPKGPPPTPAWARQLARSLVKKACVD